MKPSPRSIPLEKLSAVLLFLFLSFVFAYTFPRWADPNQSSRVDMILAVVDDGTFQIDRYVSNTVDYAKYNGHYYSDKAPGAALLGIAAYFAAKPVLSDTLLETLAARFRSNAALANTLNPEGSGILTDKIKFVLVQVLATLVASILPSAGLGVLLFLVARRFTQNFWARIGLVFLYSFLTPAFAYAGAFYGHQLSAALLFGAFALTLLPPTLRWPHLLGVGFLLAFSIVSEYPSALMVVILAVYTAFRLFRQKTLVRIFWALPTAVPVIAGWMAYNNAVFGGPLSLGYSNSELWVNEHSTGFMSLTFPHWDAVWGITFGLFRGLFFMSPILLLAVPGFVYWWKSREYRLEFWIVLASILSIFLFNSSSIMWWGGFSVGPRYLLPMLPFLTLPILYAWRSLSTRLWSRLLVYALSFWSWFVVWSLTLGGQAFPPDRYRVPLIEYSLPNLAAGSIARNAGMLLVDLNGWLSLVPLLVAAMALLILLTSLRHRNAVPPLSAREMDA
jgi:hypothetical protein